MCLHRLLQTPPHHHPHFRSGRSLFSPSLLSAEWSCGRDNQIKMTVMHLLTKLMLLLLGAGWRECQAAPPSHPLPHHHHSTHPHHQDHHYHPPAGLRITLHPVRCRSRGRSWGSCGWIDGGGELLRCQQDGPAAFCSVGLLHTTHFPTHQLSRLVAAVWVVHPSRALQGVKVGDSMHK